MKNKKLIAGLSIILLIIIIILTTYLLLPKEKIEEQKQAKESLKIVLNENNVPKYIDGAFSDRLILDKNSAIDAIEDIKDLLNIKNVEEELYVLNIRESENIKYYQIQQKYNGIDILGAKLMISVNEEGQILAINGNYLPDVLVSNTKIISTSKLKAILTEKYGEEIEYEYSKKIILINNEYKVVYIANIITENSVLEVTIDANEGAIISEENAMDCVTYVYTGEGLENKNYTINLDEQKKDIFSSEKEYLFKDNERNIVIVDASGIGLDVPGLVLSKIFSGWTPFTATMNKKGNLSYSLGEDKLKTAITAMAHYKDIYDFYKNILGRDSYDDKGSKIIVNLFVDDKTLFGENLFNATWAGGIFNQMFIGSMNDAFSTSFVISKDILAHEFTHGVIEHTANFASSIGSDLSSNEAGALDEAYADILGVLIDGENWIMAEKISETLSRNFENPTIAEVPAIKGGDYFYPDYYVGESTIEEWLISKGATSVYDYYDDGGVHHNSTVVSHAAYLMYKNGAFESTEEMAKVWYNSLFLLSEYSNFEDCALAVIQAAKNLNLTDEEIKIVTDAFYETKMLEIKYASIQGEVTNSENNETEKNVLVTAVNKLNQNVYYETYTNEKGEYNLKDLPLGEYIIVFEKSKFKDSEKEISLIQDTTNFNGQITLIDEENYKNAEIVFVLDISLSMDESDPTNISRQIISNILSKLDDDTKTALVTFTKEATVVNNGLSDKSIDNKILMTDVFNIVTDDGHSDNSGTNGRVGIEKALSLFNEDSKTRKYIVFLTDGMDVVTTTPSYEVLAAQANDKKVRIITIGLGSGNQIDEEKLKALASSTNGKYYHATTASKLYEFDLRIFEELE